MAWYASVAAVSHSTSGLTTTITFRVTQRVDGSSYDAVGWDAHWTSSTGASGNIRLTVNRNGTITRDFNVSVDHSSINGAAPNVTVTVSNLRDGYSISDVVSRSASFQPPTVNITKVSPQVSNVKLVRDSDSQLTINWTNNGSRNTVPNHNYVDIKTDDGPWVCILNGGIKTSHVWTGASKGHKYQVRVNSGNSAGHNTHVESNIVYTAPKTPSVVDGRSYKDKNGHYFINFSINKDMLPYCSDKIELEYQSNNGDWKGQSGLTNKPFVFNSSGKDVTIPIDSETQLLQIVKQLENNTSTSTLPIRARVYNNNNTLFSDWSSSFSLSFSKHTTIQIEIPDSEIYYIYKTDPLPNGKIYTAKIPKKIFDKQHSLSGKDIAVFFGFRNGAIGTSARGFSPAVEIGITSKALTHIVSNEHYTKDAIDRMDFSWRDFPISEDVYDRTYTWTTSLSDEDLELIAPSNVQIKIQVPDPPQKHFIIKTEEGDTVFSIPQTLNTDSDIYDNSIPDTLDWITKKAKYVSGPQLPLQISEWWTSSLTNGRYFEHGGIHPNGNLYYTSLSIKNDSCDLSNYGPANEIWNNWLQYQGDYTVFEKKHSDNLRIKEPQIYINIPGTKTYTTYNHPSAGDGGYNFTLRFPDSYRSIKLINNDPTTTIYTIYKAVQDGYLRDVTIENESIVDNSAGRPPIFYSPQDGIFHLYGQTGTGVYDEFALPGSGIDPLDDSTVSFHKVDSGIFYPNNNLGKIPVTDLYSQIRFE